MFLVRSLAVSQAVAVAFVMAVLAVLWACTPSQVTTANLVTTAVAQDVQTLAAGMPAIEAALQSTGKMSAAQASQVQDGINSAVTAAKALAAMPTIPGNAPALQTFESGVNAVLSVASAVAPNVPEIQAAQVIVPLIEVGANLVVPQIQAIAPSAPAPSSMTPADARAVLRAAARG